MAEAAHSIDLSLRKKLSDRLYRQSFFLAEASALIAAQIIALRKKRGMNQTEVAKLLETKQPAISRVERADYQNWNFNTLRKIADALDARIRVVIQPAEEVLAEYDNQADEEKNALERVRSRENWSRPNVPDGSDKVKSARREVLALDESAKKFREAAPPPLAKPQVLGDWGVDRWN